MGGQTCIKTSEWLRRNNDINVAAEKRNISCCLTSDISGAFDGQPGRNQWCISQLSCVTMRSVVQQPQHGVQHFYDGFTGYAVLVFIAF